MSKRKRDETQEEIDRLEQDVTSLEELVRVKTEELQQKRERINLLKMSLAPPPKVKCNVEDCNGWAIQGGVCRKHGAVKPPRTCRVEGCMNKYQQGGLCIMHGAAPRKKICTKEGCTSQAKVQNIHYQTDHNTTYMGTTNNFISLKTLIQRLQYGRKVHRCVPLLRF